MDAPHAAEGNLEETRGSAEYAEDTGDDREPAHGAAQRAAYGHARRAPRVVHILEHRKTRSEEDFIWGNESGKYTDDLSEASYYYYY